MPRVSYKKRREFVAELLQHAFFGAIYTAIGARKDEESLTRAKLGSRMGREKTGISKLLSGPRNWQLSTISDLSEALGLRLDFSLVDKHFPARRFTATGIQYDLASSLTFNAFHAINATNLLSTQTVASTANIALSYPGYNQGSYAPSLNMMQIALPTNWTASWQSTGAAAPASFTMTVPAAPPSKPALAPAASMFTTKMLPPPPMPTTVQVA
jgi:hypothetical protein